MEDPTLALVHGPKEPHLVFETLGKLMDRQAAQFPDHPAAIFPWQAVRLSYRQLVDRSKNFAKALLEMGLRHGDCVGIMAGNCHQYLEVFLGGARIGCPVFVFNNTYTPEELRNAVNTSKASVSSSDILNLQFTSGTTGSPKAAMLTHVNLINDARFVGAGLKLTSDDVICCPPPLFHCFGLVMGFLASFCYGSTIVFPSDFFDAKKVVDAIVEEDATVLLGVPTMYVAELEVMAKTGQRPRRLRTGLASGSAVSQDLMNELRNRMGVEKMLIAYGMTETSPVTFLTDINDSDEKRTNTVGRVFPHTSAKIIDKNGKILPSGQRGEICTSGFALQKGYWKNEEKTAEVMRKDENGLLWMHTGDEGIIDQEEYLQITGRIKDLIIRGGENIFPREIEERITAHPSISEASVVGVQDSRYGEVVGCFLKIADKQDQVSDEDVKRWVSEKLGRHKTPQYIFWIGNVDVGVDFPKTGSGKHQKHIMRDIANQLISRDTIKAKL
ncbi:hypothetical protein N7478_005904 [Penicillium angulare]|uniref:uncharacterized protein n=1 Tax=Penicillium angulare TaxID=116970 RepID=UPI0025401C75|nr:uncharacterized protein N7478_005904 [Penicillium angulare]KAJ5280532.1 hypothetical protein N7478_005904 [Penicillium angulare]